METFTEIDKDFVCDIQAPCFQLLSASEVELIRASKTQVLFRKGENLTKQGTFATYVMFIMRGFVKQYVEGDGTHNYNLRIVKDGDFLGLSSVFAQDTFAYSTIALADTRVFLIGKEAIAKVLKQNGSFAYSIIKRYSESNAGLYNAIRNLMYKQMNGRIADALLYLSSEEFADLDIFNHLSRKDIGDFAGLSAESTVKILKSFEKDGYITLNEKNIILLNKKALIEISRTG
ncbi:MAG: Crp/Fnr family transcriptional regulator [Bacteroidota bacterium]